MYSHPKLISVIRLLWRSGSLAQSAITHCHWECRILLDDLETSLSAFIVHYWFNDKHSLGACIGLLCLAAMTEASSAAISHIWQTASHVNNVFISSLQSIINLCKMQCGRWSATSALLLLRCYLAADLLNLHPSEHLWNVSVRAVESIDELMWFID